VPWVVEKRDKKWCVFKEGYDGKATGDSLGCHPSESEARNQQKALYSQESRMKANLLLGAITFQADQDDPRFLRFKRAVLARAEVNGNNDSVTERELKEVAATMVGTAIDLEHADTDNYGVFTGAVVEPDSDFNNIPTLFVDGYLWRHRLEARGIHPEDLEGPNAKYKLSIEADATEAECSVCGKTFSNSKDYCKHIDGMAHKLRYGATRILRGLRAMGGALTRKPAGTEAGFARSTIYMVASHMMDDEEMDYECSESEFYAYLGEMGDDDNEYEAAETPKKPYGDVAYADPGLQKDKKKRYPVENERHVRAAWNYINKAKNAAKYSSEHLASIKRKIISAWKRVIDKSGPPSVAEKSRQEASMNEEEVRAAQETPAAGSDKPTVDKVAQEEAKHKEERDKLNKQMADMDAVLKDVRAKLDASAKEKEELMSQLKASRIELLRSQLVGAVMEAEEFETQKDALYSTPPEAIRLMLRPRKDVEKVQQRMAVAAAERVLADDELTV